MTKKQIVFILTFCLAVIGGSVVSAQSCSNVTGDWDFSEVRVAYDANGFGYTQGAVVLHITNQNGCLFYGKMEVPGYPDSSGPFTGAINGKAVNVTFPLGITNCTLSSKNKMFCTINELSIDVPNDGFGTHQGTAIRR